ncbi:hypothetical protein UFOVP449_199 [uncultured Caudovirales phage]|uniref:Uncharacterized protein n=1 Tax=uncultured Caudovirales phage TaxID=2100421 RepID=A0A6J5MB98_9CAUD|nr:hypothetical protein UFOVP449_199 [uncultured Caudovirales phage]
MINETETLVEKQLADLKEDNTYIALSLYPPMGYTTIQKQNNRIFINEGRQGKWEGISESFYDLMVSKYDSRYLQK